MSRENPSSDAITFVALLGASEGDVVTLAELHRNPRVHIVGVYDPHPLAVGHELSEILGIMHGHEPSFLDQIAEAAVVVLPRDIHHFAREIEFLRQAGCTLLNQHEALDRFVVDRVIEHPAVAPDEGIDTSALSALDQSLYWLEVALERESFLRALLSVAVQAVDADKGSVQLFVVIARRVDVERKDVLAVGHGDRREALSGAELALEVLVEPIVVPGHDDDSGFEHLLERGIGLPHPQPDRRRDSLSETHDELIAAVGVGVDPAAFDAEVVSEVGRQKLRRVVNGLERIGTEGDGFQGALDPVKEGTCSTRHGRMISPCVSVCKAIRGFV